MSAPKHTPGPWEAANLGDYTDFDGNSRVILGDDRRIAVVQHCGTEEDEANTTLFEAAPDLLAAAKALHLATRGAAGEGPPGLDIERELFDMESAIAKAEGREDG